MTGIDAVCTALVIIALTIWAPTQIPVITRWFGENVWKFVICFYVIFGLTVLGLDAGLQLIPDHLAHRLHLTHIAKQ